MKSILNIFRVLLTFILSILLTDILLVWGLFYSVRLYLSPWNLNRELNACIDSVLEDAAAGNFLAEEDVKTFIRKTVSYTVSIK